MDEVVEQNIQETTEILSKTVPSNYRKTRRKIVKITSKEARLYVRFLLLLKSDVFWNWYSSSFQAYVRKDPGAPTREKIIDDLYTMISEIK
jgi:hypothetical protein